MQPNVSVICDYSGSWRGFNRNKLSKRNRNELRGVFKSEVLPEAAMRKHIVVRRRCAEKQYPNWRQHEQISILRGGFNRAFDYAALRTG